MVKLPHESNGYRSNFSRSIDRLKKVSCALSLTFRCRFFLSFFSLSIISISSIYQITFSFFSFKMQHTALLYKIHDAWIAHNLSWEFSILYLLLLLIITILILKIHRNFILLKLIIYFVNIICDIVLLKYITPYTFYFILKQNKTGSRPFVLHFSRLSLKSWPHPYSDRKQFRLGKITRITAQFHRLSHYRPTDRNSGEKRNRESRRNLSKTGRGRIRFRRIASIRERVNLHSIKFIVIKSISAIQPAWPLQWHTPRTPP